jgi:hypothetical protein
MHNIITASDAKGGGCSNILKLVLLILFPAGCSHSTSLRRTLVQQFMQHHLQIFKLPNQ